MCFDVAFSSHNDKCESDNVRRFALQLLLNTANPRYNITLVQENTTITIDDCEYKNNDIIVLTIKILLNNKIINLSLFNFDYSSRL